MSRTELHIEILFLRAEGKSFKQIKKILNCSLSTISYYCSDGQKRKTLDRQNKNRANYRFNKKRKVIIINKLNRIIKKIDHAK